MRRKIVVLLGLLIASNALAASDSSQSFADILWGTPVDGPRLYLGMWSLHLNENSRKTDRWNNELVGGVYKGVFAGTLLNSFSDRAFAAGFQRNWWVKEVSDWEYSVGYRLGLISGYDSRMSSLAEDTPVLPFAQLLANVQYKRVGLEIAFAGIVFSASAYINF